MNYFLELLPLASEKRISENFVREYALDVAEAGRRFAAHNRLLDLPIETQKKNGLA
jgi:hypothetical protein